MTTALVEQIDELLPQTQCRKCGFQGCRPYAEAIADGRADINQCPPGGEQGILKLAALTGIAVKPLDPAFGIERPRMVAVINEEACIGCTKCLPPCPVDAIIGASKHMHTVVAEICTGCELCVAPCPVDCIVIQPSSLPAWGDDDARLARRRYLAKTQRLERQEQEKALRLERQKQLLAGLGKAKTGH